MDQNWENELQSTAHYSDKLNDAVDSFLALPLSSARKYEEALSLILKALLRHLSRYNPSVYNYANDLDKEL